MKTMNYSIIRCICALVLGVLLVACHTAEMFIDKTQLNE